MCLLAWVWMSFGTAALLVDLISSLTHSLLGRSLIF